MAAGSPALHVLTDFSWELPSVIEVHKSIDEALQRMIAAGVRALLVVRDDHVLGLVTSYDIQGERPLQILRASNYTRHDEIEVGDVMTPWSALSTLNWPAAEVARVHYLEDALGATRASHILLIEHDEYQRVTVRGLLSRKRLERQLGRVAPEDSISSTGDTSAHGVLLG
ncbi:MAG TPA: CBS domain-containing protein [Steroidobacteraceae bacterium]|nr:CBS domain-containing protein [Steroidobacteraceae bacterium]